MDTNNYDQYKTLTLEVIEKAVKEMYADREAEHPGMQPSLPFGLLSEDEKHRLIKVLGKSLINGLLGEHGRLYHIGNGCITGDGGWKLFNKAIREAANKYPVISDMPFFEDIPLNGAYGFDAKIVEHPDKVYIIKDLGNNQYVFSINYFCKGDVITNFDFDSGNTHEQKDDYHISQDMDILMWSEKNEFGWVYTLDRPVEDITKPFRKICSMNKGST